MNTKNKRDVRSDDTNKESLGTQELEILQNEYSMENDFYVHELASRRDYLKWYTSLLGPGIALVGYFVSKNQPYLIVCLLLSLIVLGLAAFRVVLGTSLGILDSYSRLSRIQAELRIRYPKIAACTKPHTLPFSWDPRLGNIPLFSFRLPYILTIFVVLNSGLLTVFVFLSMEVALRAANLPWNIFLAIATYFVSHITHRLVAVKSYMPLRAMMAELYERDLGISAERRKEVHCEK